MKQLSEQELREKIQLFLKNRSAAHEDLLHISSGNYLETVVSRVKNSAKKSVMAKFMRPHSPAHF